MFKSVVELVGIPLEIDPKELMSVVHNAQHLRDLDNAMHPLNRFRYITISDSQIRSDASHTINYYYIEHNRTRLSVHSYGVAAEKLLILYNKHYKQKSSKLESFVRRTHGV